MPLTAIFTKQRPNIGGIVFDAILEESDELQTDVTRYPVEDGSESNDHAVSRNQVFTLLVAVSDNPARALAAQASQTDVLENLSSVGLSSGALQTIIGGAAGIGVGALASRLPGNVAALAGLGASIANASFAAGQAMTRSGTVLEEVRKLQKSNEIFTLATSKGVHANCIITNTRRVTNPRNENGLELAIDIEQLRIMNTERYLTGIPVQDDTAAAQATPYRSLGRVTARPL